MPNSTVYCSLHTAWMSHSPKHFIAVNVVTSVVVSCRCKLLRRYIRPSQFNDFVACTLILMFRAFNFQQITARCRRISTEPLDDVMKRKELTKLNTIEFRFCFRNIFPLSDDEMICHFGVFGISRYCFTPNETTFVYCFSIPLFERRHGLWQLLGWETTISYFLGDLLHISFEYLSQHWWSLASPSYLPRATRIGNGISGRIS